MWTDKRIAVVVPAHDEERLIGRMLRRVPDYVDSIIVVDDGSTDGTRTSAAGVGDARIRIVSHGRNLGVGAAIVSGYRAAFASGADVLAVMAADDQMDPADLASVIEPLVSDRADYVKGNRFVHPAWRAMPFLRRAAGVALSAVTRFATGLAIDDSQCGYTAISAHAAAEIPLGDLWPGYGYPNDLLGLLAAHDKRVAEVPVRPVYADETSGVRPWHVAVVLGVIARRCVRSRRVRTNAGEPRGAAQSAVARATIASAHFSVWPRSKQRSSSSAVSREVTSESCASS